MTFKLAFRFLFLALILGGCHGRGTIGNNRVVADVTVDKISAAQFPDAWARTWCARQQECDQADFQNRWQGDAVGECVRFKSEQEDFSTDWNDLVCGDYQSEGARLCLESMRTMACGDWARKEWRNACKTVYGC